MRTALGVVVAIALWGCIAAIAYLGIVKQVERNRAEGRRLQLAPWAWALIAGLVVGAAVLGWFVLGPLL
jgi:hypothetical protein